MSQMNTEDRRFQVTLLLTARLHVEHRTPYLSAIDDLRQLADGRPDLLAHCAGMVVGGYVARPADFDRTDLRQAAMLIEAGARPREVTVGFEIGFHQMGGIHPCRTAA